jgi:hypothetical protein
MMLGIWKFWNREFFHDLRRTSGKPVNFFRAFPSFREACEFFHDLARTSGKPVNFFRTFPSLREACEFFQSLPQPQGGL